MIDYKIFNKPVIFFSNAIGDHIIALPTLRALSQIFNSQINLMALPNAYSDIFSDIDFKNKWTIQFDNIKYSNWTSGVPPSNSSIPFNIDSLAYQGRESDLFMSLSSWYNNDLSQLIQTINPEVSVGFFPPYSHILLCKHPHIFDIFFEMAFEFNQDLRIENFAYPPQIQKKNIEIIEKVKSELKNHRILIVHADTKKKKMWSPKTFLETIDKFLISKPNFVAIILGSINVLPLDYSNCIERIINLCGLPINLTLGLIGIGDLFIGIDSCMLHAADLFRIPSVGIFGPTNPNKWGFRFTNGFHICTDSLNSLDEQCALEKLYLLA